VSPALIGGLLTALLFVLFLIGFEIGFSMALAGFIGYAIIVNVPAAMRLVAVDTYSVISSYGLIVISLFVLMGQIATAAGISRNLYQSAFRFLGHIPGGLAIGTVAAATAFKAICGSAVATSATFASIAIPEMDRYGYDKRLSCGTTATVGTLGTIIPPSVVLIIYGLLTETSIGKLFLAGIIPGLMIALSFVITLVSWCKINPNLGPRGEKSTWKQRIASLPSAGLVFIIFLLVVGGLMIGVFSPTEAGSVGAFAVLLLAICKRSITVSSFIKSVMDSLEIACMVLVLLIGATILGHFFAVTKMPYLVADWLGGLAVDRNIVMILIFVVFLIGGSFIEDLAFLILAVPILLPLVLKLGYDPIWFGMIVCVLSMIGGILPPMAINVFVVSGIAKVPIGTVYKGIYPFILGMYVCLFLLLLIPEIALWLPNLLMK
jgi:C4-dicarboxylate transporter, DctM subunit